jgi:PAS domain S-box-containing protein
MLLKKFISKEVQFKLAIALIMTLGIVIFMIYHNSSEKKHLINESKLLLYEKGKAYEYEISSELAKYTALSELMTISISKKINNPDFKSEAKNILRKLLYSNERLQSISIVLNKEKLDMDSSSLSLSFKDSLTENIICLNKLKSGIYEDFTSPEFSSLSSKIAIQKAVEGDGVEILSPELKKVDDNNIYVIPVVSGLYFGKQYIGYIVMHISMAWLKEINTPYNSLDDNLETFVSAGDGQVFALNKKDFLISEPVSKVCFTCSNLLADKGSDLNSSVDNDYLTICFPVQFEKSMRKWNICLRCEKDILIEKLGYNVWYSWLVGFTLCIAGILLLLLVIVKREIFWKDLFKISNGILTGKIDIDEYEQEEDNTSSAGRLKSILLKIVHVINKLTVSNTAVVSGDFSGKLEKDQTQYSILKSTESLQLALVEANNKLESSQAELKQNNEFNDGQEKISQVLQSHYHDLKELSENVIYSLVEMMKISMGAIFLMTTDQDGPVLELEVSYAYSENRHQKRSFRLGESLIGACAAEQRTIHLKKIPENYLSIMSGLGLSSPKSILIVPLIFESKVLGVIELGSLQDFDEYNTKFAETAALRIASTLSLAQNNKMNSELLEKTRLQTMELEEHDRKTIDALNQLQELHIKTAQNEAMVRSKLEAMNNTLMMVEYTTQWILIDANYKFLNTMHYSIEEIRGNNVLDLLKEDERDELVKIIDNVKKGNFYEGIMRRHTKLGHEKWFLATYTPVFNETGAVENILFFAVDITRIRMNEEQLKKKNNELTEQVSDLRLLLNK